MEFVKRAKALRQESARLRKSFKHIVEQAWWSATSYKSYEKHIEGMKSAISDLGEVADQAETLADEAEGSRDISRHDLNYVISTRWWLKSAHRAVETFYYYRVSFNEYRMKFVPGTLVLWDDGEDRGSGIILNSDTPFALKVLKSDGASWFLRGMPYVYTVPSDVLLKEGREVEFRSFTYKILKVIPFVVKLQNVDGRGDMQKYGQIIEVALDTFVDSNPLIWIEGRGSAFSVQEFIELG